jgi:hypothetical protein
LRNPTPRRASNKRTPFGCAATDVVGGRTVVTTMVAGMGGGTGGGVTTMAAGVMTEAGVITTTAAGGITEAGADITAAGITAATTTD